MNKPNNIDEYISGFGEEIQSLLQQIRKMIASSAPAAVETISYGVPTFKLNGKNLVHFAAFKNHIGFYPTPSGTEKFAKELSGYKQGKGSVQFPFGEPMPMALIEKIVKYRVQQSSTVKPLRNQGTKGH